MKNYDDLTNKEKFLEFVLEILNECLTAAGIPEGRKSFERLEALLKQSPAKVALPQVAEARKIFNQFAADFEGTEASMFASSEKYNPPLAHMRDLLMEAYWAYGE